MEETLKKYLESLNNPYGMSDREKYDYNQFFDAHPELNELRDRLVSEGDYLARQAILDEYLKSLNTEKDLTGELNSLGFNLEKTKDIRLDDGKRIVVMFKKNQDIPIALDIDPNVELVQELKDRMNNPKYQGPDFNANAESLLDDYAKEKNAYQEISDLDKYDFQNFKPQNSKYSMDKEKIRVLISLYKKAVEANETLTSQDRYMYIDEENNYIMTGNGKVFEAKVDKVTNEITIESPDASEFKDEYIDNEGNGSVSSDGTTGTSESVEETNELKDESYEDKELEDVYEEVFTRGGIDPVNKNNIMSNLKNLLKNPDDIYNMSDQEQVWYQTALNRIKEKEKTLKYLPLKQKNDDNSKEEGASSYLYIAIFVLLVAFAVLMYFVFKR